MPSGIIWIRRWGREVVTRQAPRVERLRQINLPKSNTGKLRASLYKSGRAQIKSALEQGFYLEAIALTESMIADRLEARWAWRNNQAPHARRFSTVGSLAKRLLEADKKTSAIRAYQRAVDWAKKRNEALHEMFKLHEAEQCVDWRSRYSHLESVAKEGIATANAVDAEVKKLNKHW